MKLAIGGATGLVGAEVLRQALRLDTITSIVAIGRRKASIPEGLDSSKLSNVVLQDFNHYDNDVLETLAGTDACIWTIAITPSKAKRYPFEEVKRVAHDYALSALKAVIKTRDVNGGPKKPIRFLYYSGVAAERDQTKTPMLMAQYALVRGEAENVLLKHAAESNNAVELCVAKPGLIMRAGFMGRGAVLAVSYAVGLPTVKVEDCAAASLQQCIDGFEKEPLWNADLARIGSAFLRSQTQ